MSKAVVFEREDQAKSLCEKWNSVFTPSTDQVEYMDVTLKTGETIYVIIFSNVPGKTIVSKGYFETFTKSFFGVSFRESTDFLEELWKRNDELQAEAEGAE